MATTVKQVIKRSLRLIQAIDAHNEPGGDEVNDALFALNGLLASWVTAKFVPYTTDRTTHTLTPGTAAYTIGPSGDINITRPSLIDSITLTRSGIDYEIRIVSRTDYNREPKKDTQGLPFICWFEPGLTTGTLTLWPVPDSADTLTIDYQAPISAYTSADSDLNLPPEFDEALTYNLAVSLAAEYGVEASPTVHGRAADLLRKLKRHHSQPTETANANMLKSRGRSFLIEQG